ncbi:LOW QUALITY PROTEIN: spondin-1-like, partial [Xenia sp. Carnegie-2017]|uniref:LOW QUALITY PROTEIN: spondin-1-like n=1 Tax=Xenia sp. Carnegie-2017 TaxID=2897299 RepID=UPI001F048F6B
MIVNRYVLVCVLLLIIFNHLCHGWRRRRRRRGDVPRNCAFSSWSSYSSCTATCGSSGTKYRTRYITRYASCGGSCNYQTYQSVSCPGTCCPAHCSYSWTAWGSCSKTCQYGTRTRNIRVWRNPSCGGRACPSSSQSQKCGTGSGRSILGQCNATQENWYKEIEVSRQLLVHLVQVLQILSGCAVNSGTRKRTRRLMTKASCGGTCGLATSDTQKCTPIPISCQISSWSLWQACVPSNGRCGQGNQHRSRNITQQSYCSSPCPQINESRSCVHSCCPVNCQLSQWTTWSSCSSTCGKGKSDRTRSVRIQPSCGGRNCSILSESKDCIKYNDKDCVMDLWSSWSACDNGCGHGTQRRYRKITHQSVCRGQ